MSSEVILALLTMFGSSLVIQCPVFLALVVGAGMGVAAFTRGNRLAGGLAFGGFAALVVLLSLQLLVNAFVGLLPTLLTQQGARLSDIASTLGGLSIALGCTFSVLKTVGVLTVVGSLAVYVFRKTSNTMPVV